MNKRVVVAIYVDPDFYPPTINAILALSEKFNEVIVISRNNSKVSFAYPQNVFQKKIGKYISVRDSEKKSVRYKIAAFAGFVKALCKYSVSGKTELIILYDPYALFGWYLIRSLIKKTKKIWYHNHDMPVTERQRKFSIGWFSSAYEKRAVRGINFFSLPSVDRLRFYPGLKKDIQYFIIPNYPSLKVYKKFTVKEFTDDTIKIIFQGFIGPGHSLEEIIKLLPLKIANKNLHLILKGSVKIEYREQLNGLANQMGVEDKITWIGIGPYAELPAITASCHIGIGIHMNTDNVSKTLGTASNKIYEYAASGLPVISYDSEQFTKYLKKYNWVFFTNGTLNSIKENIEAIINDWPQLDKQARSDFEQALNFESHFTPALNTVVNTMK